MLPRNPTKLSVTKNNRHLSFDLQQEVQQSCRLLVPHGTAPNTQTNYLNPPTSDATGQSSQFLGVLYLALTGLIDSALPAAGPWAVAEKALSYLVKLGPIIWWAMSVPALTPPSPDGALRYSWYPDIQFLTTPMREKMTDQNPPTFAHVLNRATSQETWKTYFCAHNID
ncbi:hypothetical protein DSO57_1013355 [Entomophthora muscae]|uniref:Uncharacterized protein n=1 Tax=Entomophthora muscae TaxID=34485 RepID=A0ACC2UST9_9FUNG|nr:hypothetical protein DSO57_1013355 [Entomophthora muscae]